MHTLREKFVAAEAIPAGVPVFFDVDGNYLVVDGTAAIPTYTAGDLFAGISVAACEAGEFCHIAPPGADALIELTAGTWGPGEIVYFDQAGGLSNAVTAGVDQAIARVKPILTSDGATVTTGGAGVYVAVTVLNGLPF